MIEQAPAISFVSLWFLFAVQNSATHMLHVVYFTF
jgi:hypothetical protein